MRKLHLYLAVTLVLGLVSFTIPASANVPAPRQITTSGFFYIDPPLVSQFSPHYLPGEDVTYSAAVANSCVDTMITHTTCAVIFGGDMLPINGVGPSCETMAGSLAGRIYTQEGTIEISGAWAKAVSVASPYSLGPVTMLLPIEGTYQHGTEERPLRGAVVLHSVASGINDCSSGLRLLNWSGSFTLL